MNYISLINHFWQLNKEHPFTGYETLVYFGLLDTCNELRWKNPFKQKNARLCSKLAISEATLLRAKNSLSTLGLIDFQGEVGRSGYVIYKIKYPQKRENPEGIYGGISEGICEGINEGIYNTDLAFPKHKGKHKQNQTLFLPNDEKSFDKKTPDDGDNLNAEKKEGEERKKGSAQKKKVEGTNAEPRNDSEKEYSNTIPYRNALVEVWKTFYKDNFGFQPSFEKPQEAGINRILRKLEVRLICTGKDWTQESACAIFLTFLENALADDWLSKHFLLSNLEQQFDPILNNESTSSTARTTNNRAETFTGTHRYRGGTITEIQALKRGGTSDTSE